jgi:hypothetical protein
LRKSVRHPENAGLNLAMSHIQIGNREHCGASRATAIGPEASQ